MHNKCLMKLQGGYIAKSRKLTAEFYICVWLLQQHAAVNTFVADVLQIGGASFTRDKVFNKCNDHKCSESKHHAFCPQKCMLLCKCTFRYTWESNDRTVVAASKIYESFTVFISPCFINCFLTRYVGISSIWLMTSA